MLWLKIVVVGCLVGFSLCFRNAPKNIASDASVFDEESSEGSPGLFPSTLLLAYRAPANSRVRLSRKTTATLDPRVSPSSNSKSWSILNSSDASPLNPPAGAFTTKPDNREQIRQRFRSIIRNRGTARSILEGINVGIRSRVVLETLLVQACSDVLGARHNETLETMKSLATTFYDLGDVNASAKVQQRLIRALSAQLGKDHPETLSAKTLLARKYKDQGDLDRVQLLLKQLVGEWLRKNSTVMVDSDFAFGEDLAMTLRHCGYAERAFDVYAEVLRRLQSRDYDSQKLFKYWENFIDMLIESGYRQRAKEELEKVLARSNHRVHKFIFKKRLAQILEDEGKLDVAYSLRKELVKHPSDKIASKQKLAKTLAARGELARAEQLLRECLDDMPDRIWAASLLDITKCSLVSVLEKRGKIKEATELQQEIVDARRRTHGHEHPQTLWAMLFLAKLLKVRGTDRAIELAQYVVSTRMDKLGPNHEDTIISKQRLAAILREHPRGKEQALRLLQEVYEWQKNNFGPRHPKTLWTMKNVCASLGQNRMHEDHEELARVLVDTLMQVRGPDSDQTQAAQLSLAKALERRSKFGEAEDIIRSVLRLVTRALGENHKKTLDTKVNLAHILRLRGDVETAEKLGREIVAVRLRTLGPEHQDTLSSKLWLSLALVQAKEYENAEALQRQVLEGRKRLFGSNHRRTIEAKRELAKTLQNAVRTDLTNLEDAKRVEQVRAKRLTAKEVFQRKGWNEMDSRMRLLPDLGDIQEPLDDAVKSAFISKTEPDRPDLGFSFQVV